MKSSACFVSSLGKLGLSLFVSFVCFVGLALLSGCASTGTISVPALPAWHAVSGSTYTAGQVQAECQRLAPFALCETTDATFADVDHQWLLAAVDWAWYFSKAIGLEYTPESFDCDKFAKAFSLAAEISASQAGVKAQPLIARIFVHAHAAFAGVPAGGDHALNGFKSDRGYFVLEPQPGGGTRLVPLSEYPNRDAIFLIRLGG